MLGNLGMLSSVYYKPADKFVKKVRERINERMDDGDDMFRPPEEDDYVDSMGVKKSSYV